MVFALKKILAALLTVAIAGADCGALWATSFDPSPKGIKPSPIGLGPMVPLPPQAIGGAGLPHEFLADELTSPNLSVGAPASVEPSAENSVGGVSPAEEKAPLRTLEPSPDSRRAEARKDLLQGLGQEFAQITSGSQQPEYVFSGLYEAGSPTKGEAGLPVDSIEPAALSPRLKFYGNRPESASDGRIAAVPTPILVRSQRLRGYLLAHPGLEKVIQAGIFLTFSVVGIALELWQGDSSQKTWQRVFIAFAAGLFTQYAMFQVLKNWLERSVKDQARSKALALTSAGLMLMFTAASQRQPAWLAQNTLIFITGGVLYWQILHLQKEFPAEDKPRTLSGVDRIAHILDRAICWASVAVLPLLAVVPLFTARYSSALEYFREIATYSNWVGNGAAIAMLVPQFLFAVTSQSPRSLSKITYLLYTVAGVLVGVAAAPINLWWSMQNSLGALLTGTILVLTFEGSRFYRCLVLCLGIGACVLFLSLYGPWIGVAASLGIVAEIVVVGLFRRNRHATGGRVGRA